MEQINNQWFLAAIIGFLIGALIVWLFMRNGKNKSEEDIAALQNDYNQYKEKVNAHFAKTADAVDNLTKSYQDVFTHLSQGAEQLMDKKALQAQLEKRQGKAVTLAYLVDEKNKSAGQSTKIEQKSVVEHQPSSDKANKDHLTAAKSQTNNATTASKQSTKHVSSSADGKQASKQANEAIKAKTTGQSVPLANKQTDNKSHTSKTDKTNKSQSSQAAASTPIKAQSTATTVNTTNQPVPDANKLASNKNAHSSINRAQSTRTTVNTTNQPAPKSTDTKQTAQSQTKAPEGNEKTPAQEAALKAGLKPVTSSQSKSANDSATTEKTQESAIETVKRHIRDNNKPS